MLTEGTTFRANALQHMETLATGLQTDAGMPDKRVHCHCLLKSGKPKILRETKSDFKECILYDVPIPEANLNFRRSLRAGRPCPPPTPKTTLENPLVQGY